MSRRTWDDTRRTFLSGVGLGALAGLAGRGRGTPSDGDRSQTLEPEVSLQCSSVSIDDPDGADDVRIEFDDGSYVEVGEGVPGRLGSPGRVIDRVTFGNWDTEDRTTIRNPDPDCDPGPRATTFTASSVALDAAEFENLRYSDATTADVPDPLLTSVRLHFVDGSTERKIHYEHRSEIDRYGVPGIYRGSGDHAGKTIAAVEVGYDLDFTTHYLRNPMTDALLLGAESCRERIVEVVGASRGSVEYEFTVDGTIRPAAITERRSADVGGDDRITRNRDGTWTARGTTENPGSGDVYAVNGAIQSFERTSGDGEYVLREFDSRIVRNESTATDTFRIVATEGDEVEYRFTVDGTARGLPNVCDRFSADDADVVAENEDGTVVVEGTISSEGHGDTFALGGSLLSFERTGGDADMRVELNGRVVAVEEVLEGQTEEQRSRSARSGI